MQCPNFSEEKKLWKKGYKYVAGLDEAGRGPLAGPVVAAAVIFNFQFSKIKDSKKLTAKQREYFYKILTRHPGVSWGVGIISEKVIDKINILEATKLAMAKAITNLNSKIQKPNSKQIQNSKSHISKINYILIDGNFGLNINLPQKSVIKGDEKVFSIAAASIIAKVTRDRIMRRLHKKYPQYDFCSNKGYGTKAHFASLDKFGPCKIHRKTFQPVISLFTY